MYTLTTMSGTHGDFGTIPDSSPFPLPYEDNFQSIPFKYCKNYEEYLNLNFFTDYSESQEPNYLAPQVGSWEIVKDEHGAQFARQTVLSKPVNWCGENYLPMAIIGNYSW